MNKKIVLGIIVVLIGTVCFFVFQKTVTTPKIIDDLTSNTDTDIDIDTHEVSQVSNNTKIKKTTDSCFDNGVEYPVGASLGTLHDKQGNPIMLADAVHVCKQGAWVIVGDSSELMTHQ